MELIRYDQIQAITQKYKTTEQKLTEVSNKMKEYDDFISTHKVKQASSFSYNFNHQKKEYFSSLKYGFIYEIIQLDKLRNFLISSQRDKIAKSVQKLSDDKNFIISESSAHDLLATLFKNAEQLTIESLKEVYNMLICNNKNEHKSIETFKVGGKAIIKCCKNDQIVFNKLHDIQTAFNLVTNQKNDDDLHAKYNAFETSQEYKYSYFDVKYYKNGNIHVIFTDKNAVDKLNEKVGKYFNYLHD